MAKEIFKECEVYKVCCPKCSHVYFRCHWEDVRCPNCRKTGEDVFGIRIAGGHFEVDRTMYDIFDEVERLKKQRGQARQTKTPAPKS